MHFNVKTQTLGMQLVIDVISFDEGERILIAFDMLCELENLRVCGVSLDVVTRRPMIFVSNNNMSAHVTVFPFHVCSPPYAVLVFAAPLLLG